MTRRPLLLLLLVLYAGMACAALDMAAERSRIEAERAQIEKSFNEREAECRSRFVVTSCLDVARSERRAALDQLRHQRNLLDEEQRKQRAAERVDSIRDKLAAEQAKQKEATARMRASQEKQQEAARRTSEPASSAPAAPQVAASASTSTARGRPTPAVEAQRAAEYERRQAEAKAHREAIERRNAEREVQRKAKGKEYRPLPAPDSASAPGR